MTAPVSPSEHPRWLQLRLARRIHRAALRLAPLETRTRHRDDMIATFAAASLAAAGEGRASLAALLLRELWDLAATSHIDRAPHQRAAGSSEDPSMFAAMRQLFDGRLLVQSARSLARRPAFAVAAVLTLALGTAAITTLFGIVNAVLLKALPYPDADRLVTVQETNSSRHGQVSLVAPIRVEDWNRLSKAFTAISGVYSENVTDTSAQNPERLDARRVLPRFFQVYGVDTIAGRTFTPDEERFGGPTAAVISEGFWERRFNRSPAALGARLSLAGTGFTIVGVMPRTFTSAATDLWLPAQISPALMDARESRFLSGIGRMAAGVSLDQASADLVRVQHALGEAFPKSDKDWSVAIADLKTTRIGTNARPIWMVFGAVGLLWLIGIANIAGLMLVQLHRRAREVAIRTAIGASRSDLVAIVVRESLLLALAGAAIGMLLTSLSLAPVRAIFTTLPRLNEIGTDWRALAFAVATSVLSTIAFGLVPALYGTRDRLASTMAIGSRGSSMARHRLQSALVTAQIALSVLLVGAASLLLRSYVNLSRADVGFDADHVTTFHVGARWDEDRNRIGEMQQHLVEGLQQLPGVEAAGYVNFLPLQNATLRYQVSVRGLSGPEQNGTMTVGSRMVGGGYFQALHVRLAEGAWCGPARHDFNAKPQAIVNRRFVDEFAKGQRLVGRDMEYAQAPGSPYTIVGVADNVEEDAPGASVVPYVYTCDSAGSWPDPEYVVRTRDAGALAATVRQLVRSLDAGRAVFGMKSLEQVSASALDQPRLNAGMISVFAAAAMLLAAVGLYSLFMLLVAESTREIGVRLALGALPSQMTRRVFTGAARLLGLGLAVGLVLSVGASNVISALLFGVAPLDPLTLAMAAAILALTAFAAVLLPALSAGRVDPCLAMRE